MRKERTHYMIHSDRGVQYASTNTVNILKSFGIERSMSRKGNCWDNAVAESFFKSFKSELIYGSKIKSKEEMSLYILSILKVGTIEKEDILLLEIRP